MLFRAQKNVDVDQLLFGELVFHRPPDDHSEWSVQLYLYEG